MPAATDSRAPRFRPSLLAAALAFAGIGIYVSTQSAGHGFAPTLRALLALILLVPPFVLSSLAFLVTRRAASSPWSPVVADGLGWVLGAVITGLLWVTAYHEAANFGVVGLALALLMPFYVVSFLLRLVAGPRTFPRYAALLAAAALVATAAVLITRALLD